MKKKAALSIFLLLGLGILSWVFLHKNADGVPGHMTEEVGAGEPVAGSAADVEPAAANARAAHLDGGVPRLMDSAMTFGKLNALIAEAVRDEAARAEYLRHAALLCEGSAMQKPRHLSSAAQQSLAVYDSFAEKFCKDFTGNSDEYLQQLYKASSDSEVKQALALQELAVDEEGKKLAIDRAKEIIADSDEALAVQAAARYLAANSVSVSGTKYVESGVDYKRLTNAQLLAAQMLACDLDGGCGNDGYYTMVECASSNTCRPGITLDQVWRKEHSPTLYNLARKIHGGLLDMRSSSP